MGSEGDEPALPYLVKTLGADGFVFSSDFPHEVNHASCRAEIDELLSNDELSAAARNAILHGNAERLYGLRAGEVRAVQSATRCAACQGAAAR